MKKEIFQNIIKQVPSLNHLQRVELRNELDHSDDLKTVCDHIEHHVEEKPLCPHCHSPHFIKHGFQSNLIRYICKGCGRTFNALTGTSMARLRKKELWLKYTQCLLKSQTIRECVLAVGVAIATSFKWRHRILNTSQRSEVQTLSGIVEVDETFFLESQKGSRHLERKARKRGGSAKKRGVSKEQVSVLVACDRNDHEADYITGFGAVASNWLEENFTKHLNKQVLLISDSAKSFECFCKHKNIEHISLNVSKGVRVKGIFHIQHVNSYHSMLKNWMMRFHGVATKYLDHYLGWCNELKSRHITNPEELLKIAIE